MLPISVEHEANRKNIRRFSWPAACCRWTRSCTYVYFARLAGKYGPIFSIRLGSKLGVVITSPSLAREVLREQDLVFSSRDVPDAARSISYGGGQNIVWNPVGPTWRLLRRVCVREMLSPSGLENVHGLRALEFRATLAHLHRASAAVAGTPVDVGAQMFLTTMNVITGTLWGGSVGSDSERATVGKEFRQLVAEITEMLGSPNVSDFFPALARFDLQGIRRKSDVLKDRFDQMFARIIEQRRVKAGGDAQQEDFLEYMLRLEKEGGDGKAAFTMTNVREELDAVVGTDRLVEEAHLPQLHYLQAVIKETLRLHPALPLMVPHCPTADAAVAGYRVPAGCRVFVNVWAIQRDPAVWKDPLEFVPERRRICAGIAMAERMTAYSLAMLLQAFDWELPASAKLDLAERFAIVMKIATPLVAVPTSRLSKPELYSA
ncbi:hypothetical protein EJB05_47821, partial [Eragrostis curvula]